MNNDDNVCDGLDSHATYVGSVILDCLGNASQKADLRIAKVLENGRGSNYDAYTAILDLADRHVQLINCSWGGKTDNKMLAFAMKYAAEHNSIVVCSSGNDGGAVAYPAKYSDTIAVSACDSDGKIADFSNTGSEITYCAPGVDIVVDGVENSRRIVSGTSFSAPAITSMSAISIMDNTKIYISFNHSDYNGYKFNRSELQPGDYTVSVFARYNSGEGPESSVGWSSSTTFVIK